jgi:hypothetical protein
MGTERRQSVRDYSWVNQIEAVCITVIFRGSRDAVFEVLGVDANSEHRATFANAEGEQSEDREVVQIWRSGAHLVVVEPNGFAGSLLETLVPMVQGRDAVSVYWNVNAHMRVVIVDGGEVVREFDPLLYDDGGAPLLEEDGLGFGDPKKDVQGGALNVLERRTGVVLTEEAVLHTEHPTFFALANWQRGQG